MLKLKLLYLLILTTFAIPTHAAIQVIEESSGSSEIGRSLGRGLGSGLAAGIGAAAKKKKIEKEKKEEAKRIAQEKAILEEVLADYHPSKHSDYIVKILQSDLSKDTKTWLTNMLNETHEQYLKKEEQKKGSWSWLKK